MPPQEQPVTPQTTPQGTTPSTIQPTPVNPGQSSHLSVQKKRIPKWLKIVGIVVLVIIALIVAIVITTTAATKAPQKVSDQFVNEVQAGNANAAYALTSETFKEATSAEQLDDLIQQVGPLLVGEEKVTGRAIQKATGTPQTAVLVYEVETADGTNYMKIQLQKSGDVWQVISFRSDDAPLDTSIE